MHTTVDKRLHELACKCYDRFPRGEWGRPDDVRYAVRDAGPIHLRFLYDLRTSVADVVDAPRPDVLAELDERIALFEDCPVRSCSLVNDAKLAVSIARQDGFWEHSAEAIVNELCGGGDRVTEIIARELQDEFSNWVAQHAAENLRRYLHQLYH